MPTSRSESLGDFMRRTRDRRDPAAFGVPEYGHRRVPGLRRQEVADRAGISLDYYTRIEQGRTGAVSARVLESIAVALRLTADEAMVLRSLARPHRHEEEQRDSAPRPALRRLVDTVAAPAVLLGRRFDVLAANAGMLRLVTPAQVPARAPENLVRWCFTDPYARTLLGDWEAGARAVASALRLRTARYPGDQALVRMAAEIARDSPDFDRWFRVVTADPMRGRQVLRHPAAGDFVCEVELMTFPGSAGLTMLALIPVPGTGAQRILDRLRLGAGSARSPRQLTQSAFGLFGPGLVVGGDLQLQQGL
ncbi:helix-turn-helix transcriptional regulator [Actinoplanes missouriensis]|uniref:helix-turn-helix domain-containing protein n=1 Tax=Actinoplanes missouriensis TaxID=1866 RepID=UPI0033D6EE70